MGQEKKYLIQCRASKDIPFYDFKTGVNFKMAKYICRNLIDMLGLENVKIWEEVALEIELVPSIPEEKN